MLSYDTWTVVINKFRVHHSDSPHLCPHFGVIIKIIENDQTIIYTKFNHCGLDYKPLNRNRPNNRNNRIPRSLSFQDPGDHNGLERILGSTCLPDPTYIYNRSQRSNRIITNAFQRMYTCISFEILGYVLYWIKTSMIQLYSLGHFGAFVASKCYLKFGSIELLQLKLLAKDVVCLNAFPQLRFLNIRNEGPTWTHLAIIIVA